MIHKIIAVIFVAFGLMQYNDPDFYVWMPAYFLVAFFALSFSYKQYYSVLLSFSLGVYFYFLFSYYPEVSNWISKGTPTITGSMEAESPFIEFVREFFGLLLCFVALAYYSMQTHKLKKE